jgi:hypothetical protein
LKDSTTEFPDRSRLAVRLRAISSIAILAMIPVVFYYTSLATWDPRGRDLNTAWSARFFAAQADAMLHGRLDVPRPYLQGECFERDSLCYGYFGITPSLLRIPAFGILRYLHSPLTPLYVALAVILAYWAALQMVQRSLREARHSAEPQALTLAYFIVCAVALGPGGTLMFLTRPAVFEEAAAWGVAFVLLTLNHVWAWHSGERRSLVPAVLFAVAAANARPTAATACGVLGLVVAALSQFRDCRSEAGQPGLRIGRRPDHVVKPSSSRWRVLFAALCLSVLPGLTAGAVFWLKLRTPMPSPLLNEQIRSAPHWKAIRERNGHRTAGLVFAPTELVAYFRPDAVIRQSEWPFFDFRFPQEPILWVPPLPKEGAYVERVTSLTATMPLPWIVNVVVAACLGLAAWRLAAGGRRAAASSAQPPTLTREQWIFGAGLLASAAAMAVLIVTTAGITNRYLSDFFATSVVGLALGHRVILPLLGRRPVVSAAVGLVALLLVVWSIVVTLSLTTRHVFD